MLRGNRRNWQRRDIKPHGLRAKRHHLRAGGNPSGEAVRHIDQLRRGFISHPEKPGSIGVPYQQSLGDIPMAGHRTHIDTDTVEHANVLHERCHLVGASGHDPEPPATSEPRSSCIKRMQEFGCRKRLSRSGPEDVCQPCSLDGRNHGREESPMASSHLDKRNPAATLSAEVPGDSGTAADGPLLIRVDRDVTTRLQPIACLTFAVRGCGSAARRLVSPRRCA